MNYTNYFGIDVSKKTLDIMDQKGNHTIVSNDLEGFKKLAKVVPSASLCIMEATGIYHIQLATFLHSRSMDVTVVNPLRIKRFMQMKMKRGKMAHLPNLF